MRPRTFGFVLFPCKSPPFPVAPIDARNTRELSSLASLTPPSVAVPRCPHAGCVVSCFCMPCTVWWMRKRVLEHLGFSLSTHYKCCQGYFWNPCDRAPPSLPHDYRINSFRFPTVSPSFASSHAFSLSLLSSSPLCVSPLGFLASLSRFLCILLALNSAPSLVFLALILVSSWPVRVRHFKDDSRILGFHGGNGTTLSSLRTRLRR